MSVDNPDPPESLPAYITDEVPKQDTESLQEGQKTCHLYPLIVELGLERLEEIDITENHKLIATRESISHTHSESDSALRPWLPRFNRIVAHMRGDQSIAERQIRWLGIHLRQGVLQVIGSRTILRSFLSHSSRLGRLTSNRISERGHNRGSPSAHGIDGIENRDRRCEGPNSSFRGHSRSRRAGRIERENQGFTGNAVGMNDERVELRSKIRCYVTEAKYEREMTIGILVIMIVKLLGRFGEKSSSVEILQKG